MCPFVCVSTERGTPISNPSFIAVHKSRAEPLFLANSVRSWNSSSWLIDLYGNVLMVINCARSIRKCICTRTGVILLFKNIYISAPGRMTSYVWYPDLIQGSSDPPCLQVGACELSANQHIGPLSCLPISSVQGGPHQRPYL